MQNSLNIGERFYRIWIDNNQVYGEVYIIYEITDLYYITLDRKKLMHKFRKDDDSLIYNRTNAIDKYYELLNDINNKKSIGNYYTEYSNSKKISIGDYFSAILNGKKVSYTILPVFKNYKPMWTGGTSIHGERYKYIDEANYSSSPNDGTISENTPLAKAVLNKRIGDGFSYNIGEIKFSGTILEIKEKNV